MSEILDDHKFAAASLIGIMTAVILAWGNVQYGTQFTSISGEDILLLDTYVFYISYASLALISTLFYVFREDLSQSIAVFASGFWALTFGFLDIVVYLFLGYFRNTYPWLEGTLAAIFPTALNLPITTPSIAINALIFGWLTAIAVYLLYHYEEQIGS